MSIVVQQNDFDSGAELAALGAKSGVGAVASFIGFVRGAHIIAMSLEHYPGMTENSLADTEAQARQRWNLSDVRIIHRVGRLLQGEQIVFVGVASAHRGDAFAACEFIMDDLKTRAPFWKCEETAEGAQWVDARESDQAARERWGHS